MLNLNAEGFERFHPIKALATLYIIVELFYSITE
jgi:hypothetical protein